jgi:hypothetical protein
MVEKKLQTEIYKRFNTILEFAAAPGMSEEYRLQINLLENDLSALGLLDDTYYALKLNLMMKIVRGK